MGVRELVLAAAVCATCATPAAVAAQVRSDAGVSIGGQVAVKVYVTLADEETPYFPVARHRLVFYRGLGDSTVVRTDDAGVAEGLLPVGDYRLVSTEAVSWRGATYRWNVPLQVRRGMSVVDLTAKNATLVPGVASVAAASGAPRGAGGSGVPAAEAPPVGAPAQAAAAVPRTSLPPGAYKDPTTATLFSLLLTGGGQFYSGETGKGVVFLAGWITGTALVLGAAESCANDYYASDCSRQSGMAAAGLAIGLGSWVVSLVDAHNAAHRHNRRTGAEPPRVGAIVGPGAGGTARAGVAVAWGR